MCCQQLFYAPCLLALVVSPKERHTQDLERAIELISQAL